MGRLTLFPVGLAGFFFGMYLMRQGLATIWQQSIARFLHWIAVTPWRGLLAGMGTTVLLQSSSTVTVLVMGMIDSGLLSWPAGLGIILGANIGTCTTAQLLSFHLESYWWLLLSAGIILVLTRKFRVYSVIFIGLSLVLAAMQLMTWSGSDFHHLPSLEKEMSTWEGVFGGAVITAIIQSSSAFIAMVIALGANGTITLEQALPLILGSNLGTCVTAWFASIGGTPGAKKIFYSHFLLNLAGIFAFIPILPWFSRLLILLAPDVPKQIAQAHTLYNITCSLAALPFVRPFTSFLAKLPPIDKPKTFQ